MVILASDTSPDDTMHSFDGREVKSPRSRPFSNAVISSSVSVPSTRAKYSFSGIFAIDSVERTTRDRVQGYVSWGERPHEYDSLAFFAHGGPWDCGIKHRIYISEDMTRLALQLEDGRVIATDEAMMRLIELPYHYPLDF